jgi:Ca2+-binding EF-hand superfamily protein
MDLYGKNNKVKGLSSSNAAEDNAVGAIKEKLKRHMEKNSWSLNDLYKICDKSNNGTVTILNFQTALKGCLDINEANKLFMCMDTDKSNDCSEQELIAELASVNASIVFEKMRDMITRSGFSIEQAFNAVDNDGT